MKFLCDKNRLESAITPMLPAIQHKDTPKPGLRCVHIEASNEELILRATNMEISFETRIESVKVDQEGVGLVPAKQFHELLSTIHEPTVRIELTGDTLHLPTSSGDFELVTSDPEDFPGLSFESESAGIDLPVPVLKELLHSTEFACAREATRYAMNGLLVQIKDGSLHLVATDGRRLAVNGNPLEEAGAFEAEALLPSKSLQNVVRAAEGLGEDSLHVRFGEGSVYFSAGSTQISLQKILGSFPDYQNVLPQDGANTVEINKSLLESHLRRARVMTDDINPAVKLSFEGSQARVEAESAGLGSARTSFDVDLQGPGGYIVFNPNFLLDALKVAETDSVRFQFEDASTPGKFTLGEQFVYVVMPITTS